MRARYDLFDILDEAAASDGLASVRGEAARVIAILEVLSPKQRAIAARVLLPSNPGLFTTALARAPRGEAMLRTTLQLALEDPQKVLAAGIAAMAFKVADFAGGGDLMRALLGTSEDDVADTYEPGDREEARIVTHLMSVARPIEVALEQATSGKEESESIASSLAAIVDPFLPGNQGGSGSAKLSITSLITDLVKKVF